MSRKRISYFITLLIIFVIYFITAKFGLSLQAVSRFATLVWIPAGFSLAILLLFEYRYWPAIFLGAVLVNYLTGAPFFVAVLIGIGNALEALVGIILLRKMFGFINAMSRLKDVLALVLVAAPLSAAISATFGVTSLYIGGLIPLSHYILTWVTWWVGDVISIFIITPFLLLWSIGISSDRKASRTLEYILLLLIVISVGLFIFNGTIKFPINNPSIIYLVYPPIIWAALRFGQREVSAILLIFSGLAIWDTMLGYGPFVTKNVSLSLLYLQIFMIITSVTSMILAVVVAERRRLEERKDDFISMASHELRNPVTSIKLYSQIVKTKLNEKKVTAANNYMKKLDDQLYKITALVMDLLDISRMQSGKIQIEKKLFDINKLIAEAVDSLQRTTKKHKILVKGKIRKEIFGDRERIYQVLVNLINNAIKYSPEGGKIIIHCKNIPDYIQISVEDSGIGIDKNHLQRIFEKLYRVPNNQMNGVPGLGIGLYVSSEIITMHNGKIWADNKRKKGSIFHFILPIK
ncbi:MAG TPA: MASE1 domain-containing protein [Candidatus Saccharimonadales bacterium]|nr:MASE1 domain-containing protein [Candidatus Saccharimonadales bacterium]